MNFFWNFLNWIIFWIEFSYFFLNWIIFWIEFSWNSIELNIELNHFLAKFKYWIESIWVSFTPNLFTLGKYIVHCYTLLYTLYIVWLIEADNIQWIHEERMQPLERVRRLCSFSSQDVLVFRPSCPLSTRRDINGCI